MCKILLIEDFETDGKLEIYSRDLLTFVILYVFGEKT